MTAETANRIINEQEDAISDLKTKLSEMEDQRDVLQHTCDELLKTLQRIANSHYPDCGVIAQRAVAEFKA